MKFEKKDGIAFAVGAVNAIAYAGMELLPADISLITIAGRRGKTKSISADRFFFVLGGEGIFVVADTDYSVTKEDVIFVPKETPFDYKGKMQLIEFGLPPFDQAAEVDLEQQV